MSGACFTFGAVGSSVEHMKKIRLVPMIRNKTTKRFMTSSKIFCKTELKYLIPHYGYRRIIYFLRLFTPFREILLSSCPSGFLLDLCFSEPVSSFYAKQTHLKKCTINYSNSDQTIEIHSLRQSGTVISRFNE